MKLKIQEQMLLEAIKCALQGERLSCEAVPEELYTLALQHKLLPLVYEAAGSAVPEMRRQVMLQVMWQTQLSQGALEIYDRLVSQGLHPLILKGALCRRLYPSGDHRLSGDEDLYIMASELERCCDALESYGLLPQDHRRESWINPGRSVHIELHVNLFDDQKPMGAAMEAMFTDGFEAPFIYEVEPGRFVNSFDPHRHFLYLILHACKHFHFSGFGLRQIIDIGLWGVHHHDSIHWEQLYHQCEKVQSLHFAAAVFRIAREELGIAFQLPVMWENLKVDHRPLLKDVLVAGIYGTSCIERNHSAAAVGKGIRSVFPERKYLMSKYPQWKDKEYLLPLMWARRLTEYGIGVLKKENSPTESLRLAKERWDLLKYYHMI